MWDQVSTDAGAAPAIRQRRGLTTIREISGLNHTAFDLAVYASQVTVTRSPRKTRFRLLAQLCRTGLVTRRVPMKGFTF